MEALDRIGPSARGFAILILIAAVITAAGASASLVWILRILGIVFLIVIIYVVFRLWRSRREEISMWSRRAQTVFYGAGFVAIGNLAASFVPVLDYPESGLEIVIFFAVFGLCGFAMYRVWKDEHSYGYY